MRAASSAVRASGLVHRTALPASAHRRTASSWRWLGRPMTTTSMSGEATASSSEVVVVGTSQRSANAVPRSWVRE